MQVCWLPWLLLLVMRISCDVISAQAEQSSINGEISAEKRLMKHLMQSYKAAGDLGRPVRNISRVVNVTFGLGLIQLELNERDKILTMSMWTRYIWKDEYLQWDPGEYEGLMSVKVNPRTIWQPDIMLYNTADVDIEQREALAVVNYNGLVNWWPHSIFKATCSVDVTNYPFDHQECHMVFGSWTHVAKEIDIHMGFPTGIDLNTFQSDHKDSSGWDVLNINASKAYMPNSPPENAFAVLLFEISLRRKVVFSSYILTLPCVFLACFTLVVFWLPPERPDRTALAMSVFSSFMVLLLILVEAAPPTASSIPKVGVYYCFNMTIISLSVVFSTLVINVGKSTRFKERKLPGWARLLFLHCLGRAFCVKMESLDDTDICRRQYSTSCCASLDKSGTKLSKPVANHRDIYWNKMGPQIASPSKDRTTNAASANTSPSHLRFSGETRDDLEINPRESTDVTGLLHRDVMLIHNILRRLENNISEKQGVRKQDSGILKEWKDCAAVLDRLFFFLYLILIALSLILYFPRPKF